MEKSINYIKNVLKSPGGPNDINQFDAERIVMLHRNAWHLRSGENEHYGHSE